MSPEYMERKQKAMKALATASEATVRRIPEDEYRTATGDTGTIKGIPCAITATGTNGTKVAIEVSSWTAALESGLLVPRFMRPGYRNDSWPNTFTARPQPSPSQHKEQLDYFSDEPVVIVTPIDKTTFEGETGIVQPVDTTDFFRMSGAFKTPEGTFVADPTRQLYVHGWNVVKEHLDGAHMAPYSLREDNTAHHTLKREPREGLRGSKESQSYLAPGARRADNDSIGLGPSDTAGQQDEPTPADEVGGPEAEQSQTVGADSRGGVPWDWGDILNKTSA
jgi:hypothetical protein